MEPRGSAGSWVSAAAGTELPQPRGRAGSQEQHLEPAPRVLEEAKGGPRAKPFWYKSLLLPIGDAHPRCISPQPPNPAISIGKAQTLLVEQ